MSGTPCITLFTKNAGKSTMPHDVKFRLPDDLYKRVQEFATVDRRSLSNALVFMLGRALDGWDNVSEGEPKVQQRETLAPSATDESESGAYFSKLYADKKMT